MVFELGLGTAVVWAFRSGLAVATIGGGLAVVKAIGSFRKGDSDDSSYGRDERYSADERHERRVKDDPALTAELQQEGKQVFADLLGKEVEEQEMGKVLAGLKEDFKQLVPLVEEIRKKGFENENEYKSFLALLRHFYDLILTAEKHFSKASAENTLLARDFEKFKKEIEQKLEEGHSLRSDLKQLTEDKKKIDEEFSHLRTGILALHARFQDKEINDILSKIAGIDKEGHLPLKANEKLPSWKKSLTDYLHDFEQRGLKPMSDNRRPSLRTAMEAHEKMLLLHEDFARELQRVRAAAEVAVEKPTAEQAAKAA
ncbi:MAG TPA: hypothetical protein VJI15_02950 [Candidatus Nanoarchaeia archaeon]|nr:hypothetical protein [Candidatus Nanoarchaeia archaeon]